MRIADCPTSLDQFFLAVMGAQVLFMQTGFAFLEAGSVSPRGVTNILFHTVFSGALSAVAFFVTGFAFSFGSTHDSYNTFIGSQFFALSDLDHCNYAMFFFQATFCAIANVIMSGAVSERATPWTYLVMSLLMSGFIYPVIAHWCWSDFGWLANGGTTWLADNPSASGFGYQDFAGSGVVHITGGTASLVASVMVGPRIGKFVNGKPSRSMVGHSSPLLALGSLIVALCFLSFNVGSGLRVLNVDSAQSSFVSLSVTNTILSGSSGFLFALLADAISRWHQKLRPRLGLGLALNGLLAGMVSICAGADVVLPWAAVVIGGVAGVIFSRAASLVEHLLIDDPVDAIAVHLCCGTWGVIARPLFHGTTGIVYHFDEDSWLLFAWNLTGALCIVLWTAILTASALWTLRYFSLLRVSEEIEAEGIDHRQHGRRAYNIAGAGKRKELDFTTDNLSTPTKSDINLAVGNQSSDDSQGKEGFKNSRQGSQLSLRRSNLDLRPENSALLRGLGANTTAPDGTQPQVEPVILLDPARRLKTRRENAVTKPQEPTHASSQSSSSMANDSSELQPFTNRTLTPSQDTQTTSESLSELKDHSEV
eukprot:m.852299 g.852299  ORF g.852299 m.852299 type:complete len:593 (+) comp59597_c1_seq8:180-1958(+)